jgi:sigma-B regulation protein RsbU (phosphoserine phosphatase)
VRQITCKEVGGDYYDFFSLDNNKIGLLIGDVAGKGVSASLIMSNVQAIVRTEAPKQASPAALLSTINGKLNSLSLASTRFMTLFYGIFDPVNRRLVYANAGHCYPIIFGRAGGYEMVTEGGTFLGPFASMHWTDHEVELSEEDLICLYTDGVSEACIDVSDQFGEEGIISCLKHRVMGAEAALDELLGKCTLFVRNRPFGDDWTAIVLKLKRPNRGSI